VVVVLGFHSGRKGVQNSAVIVVVVVVVVLGFLSGRKGVQNSAVIVVLVVLWWWFWVFEFSLWKKKSPEFCSIVVVVVVVLVFEFFTVEEKNSRILDYYCCCGGGGGVFGFSVFTAVRGFPPPLSFPFGFSFQGVVGLRGCLLHSISSSSFCVFVVWVSGFAEQHSLHLLPTFVSHLFIHSFIEGRVSLFMKQGIQCLCPSSLSFSLEDNNTFADEI
jgi:hypothetical protein